MSCLLDVSEARPIEDLTRLFDIVEEFRRNGTCGGIYLRGHANAEWGLTPTIGRRNYYRYGSEVIAAFSRAQEVDLLDRFRRYSYAIVGRELNVWEGLFLARHHGLPVRLLDWTSNPLVALFSAVNSHQQAGSDGAIWLLRRKADRREDIRVTDGNIDPFEIKGVRMIYPTYVTPRLVAQSGCFTIHGDPWTDLCELDSNEVDPRDFDVESLKKLRVPGGKNKASLLKFLMRAGINSRTLNPDLDGLARGLWELEAIRE
jgi:hypothetical protein